MKNVLIMDCIGINEKNFSTYFTNLLEILEVNSRLLSIDSLKNDYLDYIILNGKTKSKDIKLNVQYCFINMDYNFNNNIDIYGNMITYGFGSKNTITISSVKDDNSGFVYCIQRYLCLNSGRVLEPQELPIYFKFHNDTELYALMVAVTVGLIEGLKGSLIEKKLSQKSIILK